MSSCVTSRTRQAGPGGTGPLGTDRRQQWKWWWMGTENSAGGRPLIQEHTGFTHGLERTHTERGFLQGKVEVRASKMRVLIITLPGRLPPFKMLRTTRLEGAQENRVQTHLRLESFVHTSQPAPHGPEHSREWWAHDSARKCIPSSDHSDTWRVLSET